MNGDATNSAGAWLKQQRKALDLTQEALAERVACSVETVRKIEAGKQRPSHQLAELLATHLDVPPGERATVVRLLRTIPAAAPSQSVTATASPRHARPLPIPPTSLIDRTQEVDRLRHLLCRFEVRLITLVGPPGIGKTRLALAVTAALHDEFADGICFIELAPLIDPALTAPTIATALGVGEAPGRSRLETLVAYLREKQILLVLDNFEHLLDATGLVDTLLRGAAGLKMLVTSRTPLRLYGEKEFPVPALGLPDLQAASYAQVQRADAVQLFVTRACDVQPDFTLTPENAGAVAEICARLDGLPLAIELAAARIRLLPPPTLAARLDHRLRLLTGGARNLPARQQTLSGAIAWSYDLLDAGEQQLFRRLAVFQGGRTLEAIAAVCNAGGDLRVDVVDGVQSLVEKNLLQARAGRHGEPRFGMLETIQEYAREQLAASGEEAALRQAHARYFLRLAEETDFLQAGALEQAWLDTMDDEHNNNRVALDWLLDATADEQGQKLELALRLAGAVGWYWAWRGDAGEGRWWLTTVLDHYHQRVAAAPTGAVPEALERGLCATLIPAGLLYWGHHDLDTARGFLQRGLDISRKGDDKPRICASLVGLGNVASDQGDMRLARACYEECVAVGRAARNNWAINQGLNNLAGVALEQGDYAAARALLEESLKGRRKDGRKVFIAQSLANLGSVAYYEGDYAAARAFLEESLLLSLEVGAKPAIATELAIMAGLEAQRGRLKKEKRDQAQDLRTAANRDRADGAAAYRAAVLLGVVDKTLESWGWSLELTERRIYDQAHAVATQLLGAEAFATARQAGRAMTLERAVAYACTGADGADGG